MYKFGWFLFRARATLHVQLLEVDLLLIDKLSAECCSEDRSVYGNNHESYMIPNLLRQIGFFFIPFSGQHKKKCRTSIQQEIRI